MISHFEKMLYDNGQLLEVFAKSYRLTGNRLFADAVEGIVKWLEREMVTASGAFYAALDADSEGVEGKFYLWTPDAVKQLIGDDVYPAFAYRYGLDQAPNFEGEWHLHAYYGEQQLLEKFNLDASEYKLKQARVRELLLAQRATRVRPGLDDKVLTQWRAEVLPRLKPDQAAYFIPKDAQALPDEIAQKTSDLAVSAWICEGFVCRQSVHGLDGLIQSIDEQDQEPDHNH